MFLFDFFFYEIALWKIEKQQFVAKFKKKLVNKAFFHKSNAPFP